MLYVRIAAEQAAASPQHHGLEWAAPGGGGAGPDLPAGGRGAPGHHRPLLAQGGGPASPQHRHPGQPTQV